jgi:hypothetical protein
MWHNQGDVDGVGAFDVGEDDELRLTGDGSAAVGVGTKVKDVNADVAGAPGRAVDLEGTRDVAVVDADDCPDGTGEESSKEADKSAEATGGTGALEMADDAGLTVNHADGADDAVTTNPRDRHLRLNGAAADGVGGDSAGGVPAERSDTLDGAPNGADGSPDDALEGSGVSNAAPNEEVGGDPYGAVVNADGALGRADETRGVAAEPSW